MWILILTACYGIAINTCGPDAAVKPYNSEAECIADEPIAISSIPNGATYVIPLCVQLEAPPNV